MNMDIKVLVATHKEYWMPQDKVYLPIQLGKDINHELPYIGDNTGDNISSKQPYYSELTAMYWAWKNLKADYIGINHYRRYFSHERYHFFGNSKKEKIFTYDDFVESLKEAPILLPNERYYFISTRYEQYRNAHNVVDLEICREVIRELYPDYLQSFDYTLGKTHGHILNMFVMRYDLFCDYCEWLFSILFEVEKRINFSGRDPYQQRVCGYLGERLLDAWLFHKGIKYTDCSYVMLGKTNWIKKVFRFLSRNI